MAMNSNIKTDTPPPRSPVTPGQQYETSTFSPVFATCCVVVPLTCVDPVCLAECQPGPRGLIARRVTEVAQSTLDIVSNAVDYPLCECTPAPCQRHSISVPKSNSSV